MSATFINFDKKIPDVYFKVKFQDDSVTGFSQRGIVALPHPFMNWGAENTVIEVPQGVSASKLRELTGHTRAEDAIMEKVLKNASTVLLYRLDEGGAKASATVLSGILATAKYSGTRGNEISVVVKAAGDLWELITYLGTTEVDAQEIDSGEAIKSNLYVDFEVTALEGFAPANVKLQGGTNGSELNWENAFAAFQSYYFNSMPVLTGEEAAIAKAVEFIGEYGRSTSYMPHLVVKSAGNPNHELVINVENLPVVAGEAVMESEYLSWLAGADAATSITQSLINKQYPDASDAAPRFNRDGLEDALEKGKLVLRTDAGSPRITQDQNSLVHFSDEKPEYLRYNQIHRIVDKMVYDIAAIGNTQIIGKVQSNADGRDLFKSLIVAHLNDAFLATGAIESFDPLTDVLVVPVEGKRDAMNVQLAVTPVLVAAKIYVSMTVL